MASTGARPSCHASRPLPERPNVRPRPLSFPPAAGALATPRSSRAPRRADGGLAGRAAWAGAGELARGRRPDFERLLLTPGNATRLTRRACQDARGGDEDGPALSMEAGEYIAPELSEILAHLRADAHTMPGRQLKTVLVANWGADFLKSSASSTCTRSPPPRSGRCTAPIPGTGATLPSRCSIPGCAGASTAICATSATLLRLSGLLPRDLDITPMMEEARRQLHEEADYAREGGALSEFGRLLGEDPAFVVPDLHTDLTTPTSSRWTT